MKDENQKTKEEKNENKQENEKQEQETFSKKNTITTRAEDFNEWYLDVIREAEMADYSPVRGSMIIKPYGYGIWERTQEELNKRFRTHDVDNCYFPLLIPKSFIMKEADHIEGFAPELAIVTHAGGEKLEEELVIRPTSETIMYDTFSRWITSYRDLPLKINQWANVMRWEKRTKLFLRTTEFLWQEGHTVHTTFDEANEMTLEMLNVYQDFSENVCAIPSIMGRKTESEKFAGAFSTYTVEAIMQDNKALQYATSHNMSDNFARAFDIQFTNELNEKEYAYQTSWGLSTRSIGGVIMVHGDDKGIIVPPRLAQYQCVITTLLFGKEDAAVKSYAESIKKILEEKNIRVKIDNREMTPGEKFFAWEKKGVPVRIEIGPKDVLNKNVVAVRRDTGEKKIIKEESLTGEIETLLEDVQTNLYTIAKARRDAAIVEVRTKDEFLKAIEENKVILTWWNGDEDIVHEIKKETGYSSRCMPLNLEHSLTESGRCSWTGDTGKYVVIFAKSY